MELPQEEGGFERKRWQFCDWWKAGRVRLLADQGEYKSLASSLKVVRVDHGPCARLTDPQEAAGPVGVRYWHHSPENETLLNLEDVDEVVLDGCEKVVLLTVRSLIRISAT